MKSLVASLMFFVLVGTMPVLVAVELTKADRLKADCETDIECCVAYNDCDQE